MRDVCRHAECSEALGWIANQSVDSREAVSTRPTQAGSTCQPATGGFAGAFWSFFYSIFSFFPLFFKKKNKTKIILLVGLSISVLSILSEVCKVTAIPPSATRPYVEKRPVLFLRQNIKMTKKKKKKGQRPIPDLSWP